ncbi:MAG: hypothetical protein JRD68_07750 [Deltaproteobacteria bacterium]|nr:hypothetical protein [Deltaproteobacteria bacterium]
MMHDLPDTEDVDAAAERYWPEGYKDIIREKIGPSLAKQILEAGAFKSAYADIYAKKFDTYEKFANRLGEMVSIGAEKGADEMFEDIYASFRKDAPLPERRARARPLWPEPFDRESKDEVHQKLFKEYGAHHAYEHIHEDHYEDVVDFETFITRVADLVLVGAINGADNALEAIYKAFLTASPLPPARRKPRRLQ